MLQAKEISLNNALWKILDGTGLRFALSQNRQLILMEIQGPVSAEAVQKTVTGSVTDAESGATLPAVNVSVKGTTVGASKMNWGLVGVSPGDSGQHPEHHETRAHGPRTGTVSCGSTGGSTR